MSSGKFCYDSPSFAVAEVLFMSTFFPIVLWVPIPSQASPLTSILTTNF
ncbi:hypothetical protein D082_16840 [Synechocystis sp. PCC 6714]|nr:hypothetical protein D082_16840 [Synechocystis sp. PCC 6714]